MSSYSPPRYLSALPEGDGYWRRFGVYWAIAQLAWERRAQLVRACEIQRWRCCYCYRRIDIPLGLPKASDATREHVIPKSHRGSDTDDNIVAACHACNSSRGTMNPYRFKPRFGSDASVRVFA